MQLSTKGKSKYIKRKEIKEATYFFAKILLGTRLANNIELTIHFNKELDDPESNIGGFCEWVDDNHNPREYLIELCPSLQYEDMLVSLGHEMTHLKQFARGTLKQIDKGMKWDNRLYSKDMKSPGEEGYEEQPWEVEAREMGKILAEKWLNRCI